MFGGKSQSDVSLTTLTLASLWRTKQAVRCPERRLRTQAGVSLACFRCFLCIIFPARWQSVPGQTVLVCLEAPLIGSRKPSRAQKASYHSLAMFSFPLEPNPICPNITFPGSSPFLQMLHPPTPKVIPYSNSASGLGTNLPHQLLLRCKWPV